MNGLIAVRVLRTGIAGELGYELHGSADDADRSGVLTSLHGEGDVPERIDTPRLPGVSTGRTLSPALRATISLCVIDRGHAIPRTTVSVVWGRPGTAQLEIRATVAALPFKPDNRRIDVSAL